MTYLQKIEAEFLKKLDETPDRAALARWVSGKILESYKNGITAGRKGGTVRKPRKDFPSKAQ